MLMDSKKKQTQRGETQLLLKVVGSPLFVFVSKSGKHTAVCCIIRIIVLRISPSAHYYYIRRNGAAAIHSGVVSTVRRRRRGYPTTTG